MDMKEHKLIETSHAIIIDGQRLYYRCVGEGPPLVLLHGYGMSGQMWQRCLPYLAQQHEVIVLDLPGHGRSGYMNSWQLRGIAPLLATWLRCIHLSSITLVGHSMGGAIAIHLAAYAPELIERLVLANAVGMPLKRKLPTLFASTLHSRLQPGRGGYPWPLIQDIFRRPRLRMLWRAAQQISSSDFRAELATLTMPTLIIWGEDDVLIPLSQGQALSAALPHARFVTVPNCGHRVPLSQPEKFSRHIMGFLHPSE